MDLIKIRRELDSGKTIYDLPMRVGFYARVSTDQDAQLNSLHNQISHYEAYIREQKNWICAGGYIDEGISGTSVHKRENFLRMLEDAEKGQMDFILTKEISRFSRNTLDSIQYTRQLLDCGVGVLFQNDNINTLYSDAELRLTIMASIAQDEVRRLSERVRFGIQRAYAQGKVLGSGNIYGYCKKNGKLVLQEEEAAFVKTLFTLYAQGQYGFRSLAKKLGEMGFANQQGGPINPGTLRPIIENPKYKGYYCGRITESNNYRQKKNIKLPATERMYYKDPDIPPIVSEALWQKANDVLATKRKKFKGSTGIQNRYPYSGKILCGLHGTYYYRKVWRNAATDREGWCCKEYLKDGKKGCSLPHLFSDELDAALCGIGMALAVELRKAALNRLKERYEAFSRETGLEKEKQRLIKITEDIKKKKQRLLTLSLEGLLPIAEFGPMNEKLNQQIDGCQEQLTAMEQAEGASGEWLSHIDGQFEKPETIAEAGLALATAMLEGVRVMPQSAKKRLCLKLTMKFDVELAVDIIRRANKNNKDKIVISYIETEISPIVGSEQQSQDLIDYISEQMQQDPDKVWEMNMFGRSMHDLVKDGLQTKLYHMPEDAQMKFQETLQRIINEGSGGLICIIL